MAVGLLERDELLGLIDGLVGGAIASEGGAVLVEASAGMGKTAVLDEVRSRVGHVGVLAARGVDLERDFPLGVARQLLEPKLRRAATEDRDRWLMGAAIVPALLSGHASVSVEEGAAFNALYWVLAAMTTDRPMLLMIDDVHWCDPESLRWIGFVLRRLEGLRLAVVIASRPSDIAAPQRPWLALREDAHVQRVGLAPLSGRAVRAIVCAELGAADDAFVAACHQACGGNPFVLGELLSAARAGAVAPIAANVGRVRTLASVGLQHSVLVRLTSLGADVVAVAQATALLGGDAPLAQVAALAEISLEVAARAAQALQRVELFAPGARLSFRHPLLRAAVLAGLGEVGVAAGHARVARVLWERDAPAEQVAAAHLLACDPVGERWAAEVLERAARDALARASPRLAGQLFERTLAEPVGADRRALLEAEMGGALATAGDARGIDALLSAASAVEDAVQRAGLAVRLAIPIWYSGRVSELPAVLEQARAKLPAGHPELAFQIAAVRAQAAVMGSGEPVSKLVAEALALVPEAGPDSMRTRLALALLAAAAAYANRPRRDIVLLAERALGDAEEHARAIADGLPLAPAVIALHIVEACAGIDESFARVEAGQRARGALAIGLTTTLGWRAFCHVRIGALLDAQADAEVAIETAPPESFAQLRNIPSAALARVHTERGFPDRALTLVDAQLAQRGSDGADAAILALERARVLRALRRPREAADAALAAGAEAQALGYDSACVPWSVVAAEALLELGAAEQATALAQRALALADRFGAAGPIGCALRVLGLAQHDVERLREAERTLAGSIMHLEHARCLVDVGAALRRSGQRTAAREPLAAGMEIAHRCAANALVARAHEELRAAGGRPRSVVRSGVEALTASELRAARLAADGLTNRQIAQHLFVTQKTIQTQLRATYRKLGIAGRSDLQVALVTNFSPPA